MPRTYRACEGGWGANGGNATQPSKDEDRCCCPGAGLGFPIQPGGAFKAPPEALLITPLEEWVFVLLEAEAAP